ncbi:MAG: hypothetical protein HY238_17985 [Acidobacteria bacterium]|nr:hypothetical protein [Acidobacteriota bacterium]
MRDQPTLTEAEWMLLVELLERERRELPSEIRHTRTPAVRDDLHRRLEMVDGLLQRLRQAVEAQ